jgi:RNA-splicing ligase RtcB
MPLQQAKIQLTAIRDNLPPDYSMSGARKLMSSFENYKQISRGLGRDLSREKLGIRSKFDDIEQHIKTAIKGTPKKEAESSFSQAKKQITEDINKIIAANNQE